MRYCPICQERFDEDIIKFCTRDGTPLVEETAPSLTKLPSESQEAADDVGDEPTIIRGKTASHPGDVSTSGERILIPTAAAPDQSVRPRTAQVYYPPPPPPNTLKTVVLTVLGTLLVLGFGAGLFWMFSGGNDLDGNLNINTNPPNQDLNMNVAFDSNFNFNANGNSNLETNLNTNFGTNANANFVLASPMPSPSPRMSPTPRPSPTPTAHPTPQNTPANTSPPPNAAGTPRTGPRPPMMTTTRPSPNGNLN